METIGVMGQEMNVMLKAQGKQGYDIDDVEETASESAPIKGQTIERFHTLSLHCLPRVWR